ncbi:hypothetical protein Ga0100231_003980 [Opitutaceae bacterium TAV4]|nr:hypothetical protein Ga0100231_016560 [Opitutaceae bacterium TAV4]RRJ97660.1 hypothetical protein Ga0100231_003980 [Opitutaceae bacterium TAV4]RRK02171.1 hypothetical protein Ga0100230_002935 [Opitutaceae bacterium TAV3]
MRPFERNRNLTEAERIRRIGELLFTAVIRYRHLHPEEFEKPARFPRNPGQKLAGGFDPADFVSDESEKRILRYLSVVGTASPKDFQVALEMSSATVTRKLVRLRASNLVTVSGKTNAVRYQLAPPETVQQVSMLKAA